MDEVMRMRVILEDDASVSAATAAKSIDAVGASAARANPQVAALNAQIASSKKGALSPALFTPQNVVKAPAAVVNPTVAPAQAEAAAGMAAMNSAALTLGSSALIAQKSLDLMTGSTLRNTEAILANVTALNLQAGAIKAVPTAKAVKAAGTANATADQVAAARAAKNMAINAATQEVAALRVAAAHDIASAKIATALAAQNAAEARAALAALALAEAQERASERRIAAENRVASRVRASVASPIASSVVSDERLAAALAARRTREAIALAAAQEAAQNRVAAATRATIAQTTVANGRLVFDKAPLTAGWDAYMAKRKAASDIEKAWFAQNAASAVAARQAVEAALPGYVRLATVLRSGFNVANLKEISDNFRNWKSSFANLAAPDKLNKFWRDAAAFGGLKLAPTAMVSDTAAVAAGITKIGTAAAAAKSPFYTFAILTRSVLSSATVTNLQGGVYYFTLIGRALQGNAMYAGMAAAAFVLAGVAFGKLLTIGAQAEGITTVFDNMTRNAGMAGDALLKQLTSASRGAIAQVDLMKVANRALIAGGADIASALPRLLDIARASSIATGQDMGFAYDSLVKGIVRASPKLIDNADIYLKIGDAVGEYAASVGKTVPQLNAQERQIAVLNAVLREGDKFITQMGLSSTMASEKMKSLPAAIKDVSVALGEMAVASGAPDLLGNVGQGLETFAVALRQRAELSKLQDQLLTIDTKPAQQAFLNLHDQVGVLNVAWQNGELTLSQYNAELRKVLDTTKVAVENEKRASDMRYDAIQGLRDQQRSFAELKRPITDVAAALQVYADAADEAVASSAGLGPIAQDLAKLFGEMQGLATVKIEPPKLGATALGTDTAQLRQNIALFAQLYPELYAGMAKGGRGLAEAVAPIDDAQRALINFAAGMPTTIERLNVLAVATYGAGATWQDFVTKLDAAPPVARAAAEAMGLLDFALADIVARTKTPVTVDLKIKGFEEVSKGIDSMLLSAADFMPYAELLSLQQQYTQQADADWRAFLAARPQATKLEQDIQAANFAKYYQNQLDAQTAYAKEAADIAANLTKLIAEPQGLTLKQPAVSQSVLTTDVAAWRAYADALRAMHPEQVNANTEIENGVGALERVQAAAIASAAQMGWTAAAFNTLAQQAFGAGNGVIYLFTHFSELNGAAQGAIPGIKLLEAALEQLRANLALPLGVGDMFSGIEAATNSVESAAADLYGVFSNQEIITLTNNINNQLISDYQAFVRERGTVTKIEQDLWLKEHADARVQDLQNAKQYNDEMVKGSRQAAKDMKMSADEARSGIEAALRLGLEVTPVDMAATQAGTYQDKALESARRLNAIAARGRAELAAHGDWADILKIPPDVLAGSEEGLKAWAANMSERVQNFFEPDMINWDAFLANWDQGLLDEAAKSRTMDQALDMLVKSGRVGPEAKAAAKKKIEEMFGAGPEITFASFFPEASTTDPFLKASFDFVRNKANKIQIEMEVTAKLKGASPLDQLTTMPPEVKQQLDQYDKLRTLPPAQPFAAVPAEVKQQIALYEAQQKALEAQKAAAAPGIMSPEVQQLLAQYDATRKPPTQGTWPTTLPPTAAGAVPPPAAGTWPTMLPPSASLMGGLDMTKAGQEAAKTLYGAFDLDIKAQTPGAAVASAWAANFALAGDMFKAIGTSAGDQVGQATVDAILGKIGGVVQMMAVVIAPEVAKLLPQAKGPTSLA